MVMTTAKQSTAEKQKTEPAAKKKQAEDSRRMYVGPTIPGVAIQNVIYTQTPEAVEEAKKDCPEFANLFIPIMKYGVAEEMIRKRKGYIFDAFVKAMEYGEKRRRK